MTIDLTEILSTVITLIAAIIAAFVIPWLKNKIGEQNMDEFMAWVNIAVAAAEQLYESTDGELKKAYVVEFLSSKGFKVDTEELDNAIEAAVLELHNALYNSVELMQAVEADVEEGEAAESGN